MSKHANEAKAAKHKPFAAPDDGQPDPARMDAAAGAGPASANADNPAGRQSGDAAAAGTAADAGFTEERFLEIVKAEFGARIAALESENSDLKDQYLRKAADYENFRKRLQREKQEAVDFANQSLLMDLIPIIDDFERAVKSADDAQDFWSFHEGVGLIAKRLLTMLENKWGLVRFESIGQAFDPNRHEAVMVEKQAEVAEPTVVEDFSKGFLLKERVVRSAKVKVAMPLETASAQPEGN